MATLVYATGAKKRVKVIGSKDYVDILAFEEGYVHIESWHFMDIYRVAEFVAGCFMAGSNFERVLREDLKYEGEFIGIKFEFNEVPFAITKENAYYQKIVNDYFDRFGE